MDVQAQQLVLLERIAEILEDLRNALQRSVKKPGEDELLTAAEAAALLKTTPKAIYIMKERGQLQGAVKRGSRLLIRREDLLRSLAEVPVVSPERNRR